MTTICDNRTEYFFFNPDDDDYLEVGFVFFSDKIDEGEGFKIYWDTEFKEKQCWKGNSVYYNGTVSTTTSGRKCQAWNHNFPHKPIVWPRGQLQRGNFCRNPDFDLIGVWCYTTDAEQRWERCNVEICPDDSILLYLTYHPGTQVSAISQMKANPELQLQNVELGVPFESEDIFELHSPEHPRISIIAIDSKRQLFAWVYQHELTVYTRPIEGSPTFLKSPGNYSLDGTTAYNITGFNLNNTISDIGVDSVTGNIYIAIVSLN